MKTKKLLSTIKQFFNEDEKKQRDQKKYLKEVLTELKRKKKKRQKKLDSNISEKDKEIIRKEIDVLCAQRKKGLKLLKTLK
jgi:hypothetical protein